MKPKIHVRRLDVSDIGLILASDAFDNRPDPTWTQAFFAEPGHLIYGAIDGAVDGAHLVGFASGTILLHPDKPPSLFINEVAVNPAFRRRGIASKLCETLISGGREHGCEGVWLATEVENKAACALYRALAGRETAGVVVFDWDNAMGQPTGG